MRTTGEKYLRGDHKDDRKETCEGTYHPGCELASASLERQRMDMKQREKPEVFHLYCQIINSLLFASALSCLPKVALLLLFSC